MAIRDFKDDISKDTNVFGANVYLTSGQGCSTIWFETVPQARKALKRDGIKTGKDLVDCTKCNCHYSYGTREYRKYPPHLCGDAKEKYAEQF